MLISGQQGNRSSWDACKYCRADYCSLSGVHSAFSSHSDLKMLISLGTCTAHNTDPADRPKEYKESRELTSGWLWLLETRAHSWEWQISLTGGVKRYLLALRGPLGRPRTVIDGAPFHDVWLAGVGFGRPHQDTRSAKGLGNITRWESCECARAMQPPAAGPLWLGWGASGRTVFRRETDCQIWFPLGNLWASETWFGRGCT